MPRLGAPYGKGIAPTSASVITSSFPTPTPLPPSYNDPCEVTGPTRRAQGHLPPRDPCAHLHGSFCHMQGASPFSLLYLSSLFRVWRTVDAQELGVSSLLAKPLISIPVPRCAGLSLAGREAWRRLLNKRTHWCCVGPARRRTGQRTEGLGKAGEGAEGAHGGLRLLIKRSGFDTIMVSPSRTFVRKNKAKT